MQPQDLGIQRSQMEQESIMTFLNSTFDFETEASKDFLQKNFEYDFNTGEETEADSNGG